VGSIEEFNDNNLVKEIVKIIDLISFSN